jgi:hypothetical protein
MTGFTTSARRIAWITRPGIAPMYGSAMAANLRFVAHPAQRHADELAAHRAGDRSAERRLADTRRPHQAENGSVEPLDERQHADVVEHALLHLVETVVVLVEDAPRVGDVEHVVRSLAPRQRRDPVQVRADDPRLGRDRRELAQPAKLAPGAHGDRLGEPLRLERRGEIVAVFSLLAPQLAVDRLELLLQIELALVLEQRATHVVVDLSLELEQVDLARERVGERAEQGGQLVDREQRLPPVEPRPEVRGDAERLSRRRLGALNDRHELRGKPPMQRDVLLEQ